MTGRDMTEEERRIAADLAANIRSKLLRMISDATGLCTHPQQRVHITAQLALDANTWLLGDLWELAQPHQFDPKSVDAQVTEMLQTFQKHFYSQARCGESFIQHFTDIAEQHKSNREAEK